MVKIFKPSRYKVPVKGIRTSAQSVLAQYELTDSLVNVIFVGKRKMMSIADTYKHEKIALPILAFPFHDESAKDNDQPLLGELYICYPQAVLLAAEREKRVDDVLMQLVEHGIRNLAA